KYNGQSFMESPIKIEKALPRTKGKEGGEEGEGLEASETEKPEKPTPKPVTGGRKSGTSASSSGGGGKKRKGSQGGGAPKVTGDGDALQPDPRWANELAKLKEMLAAQATP
uniref:hypothetical protein n=1 Tax=Arcanobacterium phocae TaxID=131112 RepID=UPI001C100103